MANISSNDPSEKRINLVYDSKTDSYKAFDMQALDKGGSNKNGVRIQSASKNRSFKRDSKGNLVSEVSKKERKK